MVSFVTFKSLTPSGENKCSFCWNELLKNQKIIGHKYGPLAFQQHEYHRFCIIPWFIKGKDTCPLCNNKVSNVNQYLPVWEKYARKIVIYVSGIAGGIILGASGIAGGIILGALDPKSSYDLSTVLISVAAESPILIIRICKIAIPIAENSRSGFEFIHNIWWKMTILNITTTLTLITTAYITRVAFRLIAPYFAH